MKTKLLIALLLLAFAVSATAAPRDWGKMPAYQSASVDNDTYINVNSILMFVTNTGNFARDKAGVFGKDAGTFFPYNTIEDIESGLLDDYVIFASGLWAGGKVGGDTRIMLSEFDDEYVPGPMSGGTFMTDNPAFKVYKLYKDSLADNPNSDYLNWPVDQGAPVDSLGDPDMIGDQMLWAVFNDADPGAHSNDAGNTDPLGLEVRQTTFGFDRQGALGNIVFLRLRIYNKGGNAIDSCYFSLWSDPDLGDHTDDLVGCDTTLGVGYVYNADNDDQNHYESTPPCVGYDFFQGPLIAKDTANEAHWNRVGKMWGQTYEDSVNMGMTSFNKYINGTDPNDFNETYNYMRGLTSAGEPYVYEGETRLFIHAGDPRAPEGEQGDVDFDPADRRWMQSTGPITFAPGDSTEILAAIIVGQGQDRLSSITEMLNIDEFAQRLYENDFNPPNAPAKPVVNVVQSQGSITLTWGTDSETDPGDYPFQGYTVWQGDGPSANANWRILQTFDVKNDIGNLIDILADENGEKLPVVMRGCKETGLAYKYTTSTDQLTGDPIYTLKDYYFRVSAFSHDSTKPAGDRFLEDLTVVTVTPEPFGAGFEPGQNAGTELTVTHIGPSDGTVSATIIDPSVLTGTTYRVIFEQDAELGPVWHLERADNGTVLLENQTNQVGDAAYLVVDGVEVKVVGPDPGVKTGDMFAQPDDPSAWGWDIPSGTRRFTWAGGADGFHWEGFRGALGWGGPGDGNGFGTNDVVPAYLLPNIELRLAAVDSFGVFNPADENVSYAYRYLRGAGPPAIPEFDPYIVDQNPPGGSYGFQDFVKSCPLSAWNVDVEPAQRLVVGYLENNTAGGLVDGKYWPGLHTEYDNVAGSGPREWLWIYNAEYSETVNPDYALNAIDDPMPIMYWATWARHGTTGKFWEDGDVFAIFPNKVNAVVDTFTFTTVAPSMAKSEAALEDVTVAPNPFYLYGPYDPAPGNYTIKFHGLPAKATISIYNIAGEFIDEIIHEDANTSVATWDARTSRGLPVASGIYVYVVDAEGYGQKVGKLAVFMEVEILDNY